MGPTSTSPPPSSGTIHRTTAVDLSRPVGRKPWPAWTILTLVVLGLAVAFYWVLRFSGGSGGEYRAAAVGTKVVRYELGSMDFSLDLGTVGREVSRGNPVVISLAGDGFSLICLFGTAGPGNRAQAGAMAGDLAERASARKLDHHLRRRWLGARGEAPAVEIVVREPALAWPAATDPPEVLDLHVIFVTVPGGNLKISYALRPDSPPEVQDLVETLISSLRLPVRE